MVFVTLVTPDELGSECAVDAAPNASGRCTGLTECAAVMRMISKLKNPLPTDVSDYLNTLHTNCSGFTDVWVRWLCHNRFRLISAGLNVHMCYMC